MMIGPGFEYCGAMVTHWSYIDIHADLLRRLWTDFPKRREAMAAEMGLHGTARAYVARTREELFAGHACAWATRYSRMPVDGLGISTQTSDASVCSASSGCTCRWACLGAGCESVLAGDAGTVPTEPEGGSD